MWKRTGIFIFLTLILTTSVKATINNDILVAKAYLKQLLSDELSKGARAAGSKEEKQAAQYLAAEFKRFGLKVEQQNFDVTKRKKHYKSSNIIAEIDAKSEQTLIIGAHYDSAGKRAGSTGATDNATSVSVLLALASSLKSNPKLKFNIRFIAFGAEEVGKLGSAFYAKTLAKDPLATENIIGMINLDTIVGGDNLYVHSANSKPYRCNGLSNIKYSSDSSLREAIRQVSVNVLGKNDGYLIHPKNEQYNQGETGSYSDHTYFACIGLPVAHIEATNFDINGLHGYDGYSQSIEPKLWDCFDVEKNTACDRKKETKWGKIWHTEFDQLKKLESLFPSRVHQQLEKHIKVLRAYILQP